MFHSWCPRNTAVILIRYLSSSPEWNGHPILEQKRNYCIVPSLRLWSVSWGGLPNILRMVPSTCFEVANSMYSLPVLSVVTTETGPSLSIPIR